MSWSSAGKPVDSADGLRNLKLPKLTPRTSPLRYERRASLAQKQVAQKPPARKALARKPLARKYLLQKQLAQKLLGQKCLAPAHSSPECSLQERPAQ